MRYDNGGWPGVKTANLALGRLVIAGAPSLLGEKLAIAAARQGPGLVVDRMALIESDVADGRLRVVHESRKKLPACFVVTMPGPKRAAARAFLEWLKSQS